jgi:hypothetical protein
MDKHTPGPWHVKVTEYGYIGHSLSDGSPLTWDRHAEANARLIAAAPEMANVLADCDRLLAALVKGDMPHGSVILQVRKDARALLARIEER